MHGAVRALVQPLPEAVELPGEFAGNQVNAGVKVVRALLGADHRAVGKHRHLGGLLGHARVARHREVYIGLFDHAFKVVDGAAELGFGVLPDRRGHVKIAAVDEQFHQSVRPPGIRLVQR